VMVQKHACFSMVSRGLTHYRDTTPFWGVGHKTPSPF
jgi:hypothetical protein